MKSNRTVTAVAVFVLSVILTACGADSGAFVTDCVEEAAVCDSSDTEAVLSEDTDIYVYVCGAVLEPGVYGLAEGSRVIDAVTAASGFTELAAVDYLNQAERLEDGEKIYIPTIEETLMEETLIEETLKEGSVSQAESSRNPGISEDGRVNINFATAEELQTISGIGETRAAAIISYRETNGLFSSVEELVNVSGIGDSTYAKIKDYITVD